MLVKLRAIFVAAALALGTASAASAASATLPSPDRLITDGTAVDYMRGHWRRHHWRRHHGWRRHHIRRHYGWRRGRHYGWYHHRRHRGYGWRHHRRWGGYHGPVYGRPVVYGYAPQYRYAAPLVTGSIGPRAGNPGRHLGWEKHGGGHGWKD